MSFLSLLTAALITASPSASVDESGVLQLAMPLEEGPYRVTLEVADGSGDSDITVTGESRRALLGPTAVAAGERATLSFNVWRLSPEFEDGSVMALHAEREVGIGTYDDQLTLTVFGGSSRVASVKVEPASNVTTIFLAGDSTVTDQPGVPWSAWGAMLPRYFDESVAIANLASSGRALRSFRAERRLDKLLSLLKEGDYVMIQFGHNDQKESGEGIGAFESYTRDLEQYVDVIRARGGRPILVTSMVRRRFRDGEWFDTLGDYPEAVRRVAAAKDVPLIDLHATSRTIVESLGEADSKHIYVHYPAGTFPGQDEAIRDDTHFNTYGADLLARAVVNGLKEAVPELADHLRDADAGIDPERPEPFADWQWPELP